MQFKKDLLKVFNSNLINLLVGIITGFIVPAFLSLDEYASLKTFTLYLSYIGILHFGFIDGIYIKYGGKLETEIDKNRLKGEHKFLLLFQIIVTLLSLVIGIILQDGILVAFSIAILPINIQTLFKFLYQALGKFDIYSKIMILTPNLLLLLNLLIIFVLKINNFWPFILVNIITYYIVYIGLEIYFLIKYKNVTALIDFKDIWNHFKIGSFIMIGNLASMFFYASDRWFVKFFLTNKDFAFYSFAISMMVVINTLISSVTMTFYPYLARGKDEEKINLIKKYLLIIGALSSGGYFAFEFIVNMYLKKYIPSLEIIVILFAGFPAIIIINALYINLYKVKKQEKKYVCMVLKMCLVSVVINILAILIYNSTFSIALSTTISFYIWYFYSAKDFSNLKPNIKELVYLVLFFFTYFTCTLYLNWLFSFLIYFLVIFFFTYIFFEKESIILIRNIVKKKITN
ncbi:hypothetical protein [Peribacillus loiseleuriae]|uniref:Polysaccharide biosynthesis protein C-terminal domain-containing protein n=1 Tax=Peribacillus loiseleuriae TaxID=1679170 RepID=A0A0K9GWH0_9BACI|nr:hypothetical protein [Peribacillus loiseleuriae]KMY51039.1 hypothetical protein AC625_17140 [Peribacillus loiseleuriae]